MSYEVVENFLGNPNLVNYQIPVDTEEWHKFREDKLGGSEAASVWGANPYQSKLELFLSKIGYYHRDTEGKVDLIWGKCLEPFLIDMWKYFDGSPYGYLARIEKRQMLRSCTPVVGYVVNKRMPWLMHSVDSLIDQEQVSIYTKEIEEGIGILEGKTIHGFHARQYESGYPYYYKYQPQQYMLGLELDYSEIIVLNLEKKIYGERYAPDYELQEQHLEKTYDLHTRIVAGAKEVKKWKEGIITEDKLIQELNHIQPDLSEDNPQSVNEFLSRNAKMKEEKVKAGHDIYTAARKMANIQAVIKELKKEKMRHEAEVRSFLSKHRAYRAEVEQGNGKPGGYIGVSSRKNTDRLVMNNQVKTDKDETQMLVDSILDALS